jgi:hypothetical protein
MKQYFLILFGLIILGLISCTSSGEKKIEELYPHTKDVFFLSKTIDDEFPRVHASIMCDYERDSSLWVSRIEDLSICKDRLDEWAHSLSLCPRCFDYSVQEQYDSLVALVLKQKEKDLSINHVGKWYLIDEKKVFYQCDIYFNSRLNSFIFEKARGVSSRESSLVIAKRNNNYWSVLDRTNELEICRIDTKGRLRIINNGISLEPNKCEGVFRPEIFEKFINNKIIQEYELAPLSQDEITILRNDSLKWIEVYAHRQEENEAKHKLDISFVKNIDKELSSIESLYDVNSFLKIIEKAARIIKDENDPIVEKELTAVLSKYQKKYFPIARRVFAQSAKKEMWRDDIDVKFTDKTITFTSNDFSRNAVIDDCFNKIRPYLQDLRFSSASFIRGIGGGGIKYPIPSYSNDGEPCILMRSQLKK